MEEDGMVQRVAAIPEIFRSWLENAQSTEEDKTKTEVKHASKPVVLSTEYYRPAALAQLAVACAHSSELHVCVSARSVYTTE